MLGTLGASVLGNILVGQRINRAGEGVIKAGYGNKKRSKKQEKKDKIMKTKWIFNTASSFN